MEKNSITPVKMTQKKATYMTAGMIDDLQEFTRHCLLFKADQKSDVIYGLIAWAAISILVGAIVSIVLN